MSSFCRRQTGEPLVGSDRLGCQHARTEQAGDARVHATAAEIKAGYRRSCVRAQWVRPESQRLRGPQSTLPYGASAGGREPPPEVAGRVGELGDQLRLAQRRELVAEKAPALHPVSPPIPVP